MVTPGKAPLVESVTAPKMVASCANAEAAHSTMAAAKRPMERTRISAPCFFLRPCGEL